jgi:hypothetical protein
LTEVSAFDILKRKVLAAEIWEVRSGDSQECIYRSNISYFCTHENRQCLSNDRRCHISAMGKEMKRNGYEMVESIHRKSIKETLRFCLE